jgi:outer membrane biosynthesis protein TonB
MVSRSGGAPIRTNKVRSGPDQAFTLPKGASAAPIKGPGMGNPKVKTKAKKKTKDKTKTKTKTKTTDRPKQKQTPKKKEASKTKKKQTPSKKKRAGFSKPTAFGAGAGTALTGAALVAMGRGKDKYRKYRK